MWAVVLVFAQILPVPPGLDAFLPVPDSNPLTAGKIKLGRDLFFDTRLSRDGSISCASCHDPKLAFGDTRKLAIGVGGKIGKRRAPRIVNRVYGSSFFWDGRAATLEAQVLQPITDPNEMDLKLDEAVSRVGVDAAALRDAPMSVRFFRAMRHTTGICRATVMRSRSSSASGSRYLAGRRDAQLVT
jgi:cytochrome c peroxidase